MDQAVQEFLKCRRIAVVGVSRSGKKFGNEIYKELKGRGYEVYAVHPEMDQINGDPCYKDVLSLQGKVEGVVVCVPPQKGEAVVRQVGQAGIRHLWLQMGADSPQLVSLARQLGMSVVAGKCILLYEEPVRSFHSFHRFFARLFGRL